MQESILQNIQQFQTEQSLSERVADQIIQLIRARNIEPGEKLPNEFELAEILNVARGTIREAVKILVAKNYLEIRRGKGTFVSEDKGMVKDPFGFAYITDINEKIRLAEELYEVRDALEPWIASVAAKRIKEEEKTELLRYCDDVEKKILEGEDHNAADIAFHQYIAACTHNSVLPDIITTITYSIEFFTSFKQEKLLKRTIKEHREVTNAICANDEERALKAMRKHISINLDSIELMKDWVKENDQDKR